MRTIHGQNRRLERAVRILLEHLWRDAGLYRFVRWLNDRLEALP